MANDVQKSNECSTVVFAYRTGAKHDVMVRSVPKGEMPQPDDFVTFEHGYLETNDPKVIAALRAHKSNEKNNTKKPKSRCFRELSDLDARILRDKIRTSRLPSRLHLRQLGVLNGEFQSLED